MFDPSLPLVDLHRHLDGNVRVETIFELAQQHQISLPANNVADMRQFVQIQGRENDLLGFLKKLDWMVNVLVDLEAVRRVAYENVVDAAQSGLDYAELRFSPYYMAMNHQLPMVGVVDAVIDGVYAGCQDYPVKIALIGIMSRTFGQQACLDELEAILARRKHFVGVDLAGDEKGFPGEFFIKHFNKVRDAGLNITVHAGEALGAQSVWQAVTQLGAMRIGHGVRAVEDPRLMDYLYEHQIGIESCPTSNLHTSTVSDYAHHPLKQFINAGIPVSLNTDDPGVSNIDIAHEYAVAHHQLGLSFSQCQQCQRDGVAMAFLTQSERLELYQRAVGHIKNRG
ncbi:adenosine deaminase [Celerinatantimonas diazotrophica]|uniref:adenosine deaminase n=1 Tax=Celerinatantimonas diazotrophica TaxID=412034 RepID=A0A4R1J961_9GAMM|nr:adenosine deaminase [Celerinatantimonas diazotrophica]TCK47126.1 adenosine deaminase [Celerinatantimonas diazotrophica]CAG9295898.1 Adenosine deaminase [Celerinatantimonas diazotrophica]